MRLNRIECYFILVVYKRKAASFKIMIILTVPHKSIILWP